MKLIINPPTKINLKTSSIHGLGVFSTNKITKGEIIETCPFLCYPQGREEKPPVFSNYTFCFPRSENWNSHVLVLGYGSYYNHSTNPSVEWYTKDDEKLFVFYALRDIQPDEELYINYANGIVF